MAGLGNRIQHSGSEMHSVLREADSAAIHTGPHAHTHTDAVRTHAHIRCAHTRLGGEKLCVRDASRQGRDRDGCVRQWRVRDASRQWRDRDGCVRQWRVRDASRAP